MPLLRKSQNQYKKLFSGLKPEYVFGTRPKKKWPRNWQAEFLVYFNRPCKSTFLWIFFLTLFLIRMNSQVQRRKKKSLTRRMSSNPYQKMQRGNGKRLLKLWKDLLFRSKHQGIYTFYLLKYSCGKVSSWSCKCSILLGYPLINIHFLLRNLAGS